MSDYDFILNSSPGRNYNAPNSGGTAKRALIFLGGMLVLLLVVWLVFGLLLGENSGPKDRLLSLSAIQAELIDIAEDAESDLRTTEAKALAVGSSLVLASDKQAIEAIAGVPSEDLVAAAIDSDLRTSLEDSKSINRYDETFVDLYSTKLENYRQSLALALAEATESQKSSIQLAIDNTDIILDL